MRVVELAGAYGMGLPRPQGVGVRVRIQSQVRGDRLEVPAEPDVGVGPVGTVVRPGIDVNPIQNPYVASDGYVRNLHARRFRDRSVRRTGMIHAGDAVVRAFADVGWKWGGHWSGDKDYMHFSSTGR